jgi:hypothetical protein
MWKSGFFTSPKTSLKWMFLVKQWRHFELTIESKATEIARFVFHFVPVGHRRLDLLGFEAEG